MHIDWYLILNILLALLVWRMVALFVTWAHKLAERLKDRESK